MELVSVVIEASDHVCRVFLLLHVGGGHSVLQTEILGHRVTHVVDQVRQEFAAANAVVLEIGGLLSVQTVKHRVRPGSRVHHARSLQVLRVLESLVLVERLHSRRTLQLILIHCEVLRIWRSLLNSLKFL